MILNSKTYTYAGVLGNYSRWAYRSLGLAQLFSWVQGYVATNFDAKTKKATSSVKWRIMVPVPVAEDSACGCEGDVLGTITGYIDIQLNGALDTAARTDFLAQLQDLIATAEFTASVVSLEQPFA